MKIRRLGIRIDRREDESVLVKLIALIVAIIASLLVSGILIWAWGSNPWKAIVALFSGAFGDTRALIDTLLKATPLIFTGLAAAISFRAQIWNIGGEGQFLAGAMGAYLAVRLFETLPRPLLLILILVFAVAAGAFAGALSAFLRNRFRVDVIVSTVMMNYVIGFVMSLLLYSVWGDPGTFYPLSPYLPEVSNFPMLIAKYRFHAGILVAVAIAVGIFLLVEKTPQGYELRALGLNPIAAQFKGISPARTVAWVLAVSGGVAALGGALELTGLTQRLRLDISIGFGFTGIIVAMIANLHPLGVIVSAIFFGGLLNGSFKMQVQTGVPISIVFVMQAIILLFVLSASVLTRYSIRRLPNVE